MLTMTTVEQQLAIDGMDYVSGNLPMKNGGSLRPHLLAISSEIDCLDDLPDVGSVLEKSGILDTATDGGTPNSLKSFDMSDFAVEDSGDSLPFEGILDLPDRSLPQNLLPPASGGIFCSSGQLSHPMPFLTHISPESIVQKQDLITLGGHNPFSTNVLAAPYLVINQRMISTTCNQQIAVKPDATGSKFVSSILSGTDDNRKLASRGHAGKNKSSNGSGLALPNNRDAPEYQRVMDILTEYRVQVAEKSAEAMMPCKRRKSRPLVDVVEVAKYVSTTTNQPGVVSSTQYSPLTCVPLLPSQSHGAVIEPAGDLSSSDSVASNGSAIDLSHASEQSTPGSIAAGYIVSSKPVTGCAFEVGIPHSVVSQGLSDDKDNIISSSTGSCQQEVTLQYQNPSLMTYNNVSPIANISADKSTETSVKRCTKGLEVVPECHCSDAGRSLCGVYTCITFTN